MTQIIRRDPRAATFVNAIDYINYERIEGDAVEFGVFAGLKLAVFAQGHRFDSKGLERRFVAFDSFRGLPPSETAHARWQPADCATAIEWLRCVGPPNRDASAGTPPLYERPRTASVRGARGAIRS